MLEADLLLSSYDYALPKGCIASRPAHPKESAKLLVYERKSGRIRHAKFGDLSELLPECAIVFNDTKVIKARIYGRKLNDTECELFFHKALSEFEFLAQIKGRVKVGEILNFSHNVNAEILALNADGTRKVRFFKAELKGENTLNLSQNLPNSNENSVNFDENSAQNSTKLSSNSKREFLNLSEVLALLEKIGHIPLPPYIRRADTKQDSKDYQSIFAKNAGAVAAPTASLHFSRKMLANLKKTHEIHTLTLHIGAGTFKGVECEDIRAHQMHAESCFAGQDLLNLIKSDKAILGVGTTCTRCIEFMARIELLSGQCDLFLHPKNPPLRQNYLLTNFHLPKSTLIMLVASFIGREKTLEIYNEAIKKGYKFYSYGDAMLVI